MVSAGGPDRGGGLPYRRRPGSTQTKDITIMHTTDTTETPPLLLTSREAAAALRISESTLARATRSGKIPVVRLGRNVRYSYQQLSVWVTSELGA